jgi:hypothetical protein
MPRGRRSAADLAIVPVVPGAREGPTPPPGMSEPETVAWRRTVKAMPSGWFIGSESVLRQYCIQITTCETLEGRLRTMWESSAPIDRTLLSAHAKATTTLIKLAQSLRLTPGSRATPKRAGQMLNEAKRARPWEISGGDDDPAA